MAIIIVINNSSSNHNKAKKSTVTKIDGIMITSYNNANNYRLYNKHTAHLRLVPLVEPVPHLLPLHAAMERLYLPRALFPAPTRISVGREHKVRVLVRKGVPTKTGAGGGGVRDV